MSESARQVHFDRSLYLPEAVEAAATAYAEHAVIEVSTQGDAVIAVITKVVDYDPASLVHSFCNHVLHETIARTRQAALDEVP